MRRKLREIRSFARIEKMKSRTSDRNSTSSSSSSCSSSSSSSSVGKNVVAGKVHEYDDDDDGQGENENERKQERIKKKHKHTSIKKKDKVKERSEVRSKGSERIIKGDGLESVIMADDQNEDGSIDSTSDRGTALGVEERTEKTIASGKREGEGEDRGGKEGRGVSREKEMRMRGKKTVEMQDNTVSPAQLARPRLWRPS